MNDQTPSEIGQLESLVKQQLRGRLFGFRLVLRGNGLVLQGRTRAYYTKQLAQHAIMAGTVLKIVANEIVVA